MHISNIVFPFLVRVQSHVQALNSKPTCKNFARSLKCARSLLSVSSRCVSVSHLQQNGRKCGEQAQKVFSIPAGEGGVRHARKLSQRADHGGPDFA